MNAIGRFHSQLPFWPDIVLSKKQSWNRFNLDMVGLNPFPVEKLDRAYCLKDLPILSCISINIPKECFELINKKNEKTIISFNDDKQSLIDWCFQEKEISLTWSAVKKIKNIFRYNQYKIDRSKKMFDIFSNKKYFKGFCYKNESGQHVCFYENINSLDYPKYFINSKYKEFRIKKIKNTYLETHKETLDYDYGYSYLTPVTVHWSYLLGKSESVSYPLFSPYAEHAIRPQYHRTWINSIQDPDYVLIKLDANLHHYSCSQLDYLDSKHAELIQPTDSKEFIQWCKTEEINGLMDCTITCTHIDDVLQRYGPWLYTQDNIHEPFKPLLGDQFHIYLHINEYIEIYEKMFDITVHSAVVSKKAAHPAAKIVKHWFNQMQQYPIIKKVYKKHINVLLSRSHHRSVYSLSNKRIPFTKQVKEADKALLFSKYLPQNPKRDLPEEFSNYSLVRHKYNPRYLPWLFSQLQAHSRITMWKLISKCVALGGIPCNSYIDDLVVAFPRNAWDSIKTQLPIGDQPHQFKIADIANAGFFMGLSAYNLYSEKEEMSTIRLHLKQGSYKVYTKKNSYLLYSWFSRRILQSKMVRENQHIIKYEALPYSSLNAEINVVSFFKKVNTLKTIARKFHKKQTKCGIPSIEIDVK